MLRSDVLMAERERLLKSKIEYGLRLIRKRHLRGKLSAGRRQLGRRVLASRFDLDSEHLKDARRETLLLTKHAEDEMRWRDAIVAEAGCLIPCLYHDLSGPLRESLQKRNPLGGHGSTLDGALRV